MSRRGFLFLMCCAVGLVGASFQGLAEQGQTMKFESEDFADQGDIPARFTCDGEDISPSLRWGELPAGTRSLALIVDDPDAPDPAAPKMTWVHWVLYDLPPSETSLPAGISRLPAGAMEGLNDWGQTGYRGPCPPLGRHRYFFKLYALDRVLPDLRRPVKLALENAMQGHVLAQATLVGYYRRKP